MTNIDDHVKKAMLETLKMVSERYERSFPDVPEGAVISGNFLLAHQAQKLGLERAFKKVNNSYYLFKSIAEVETSVASPTHYHPYYEIEVITEQRN